MPIIGDVTRFAVEYELENAYGGVWLYGKVCFWACGQRIGNYDLGTSLRDFLFQIEQGRRDHGQRQNPRFDSMPAEAVIKTIDEALYGGNDLSVEVLATEEMWARHNLSPELDVFDYLRIYLVETDKTARLLFCHMDGIDEVKECLLRPGECDFILTQACAEIGRLYDQEVTKSQEKGL